MSGDSALDVKVTVLARFKEEPDVHTKRWTMNTLDGAINEALRGTFDNTRDIVEVSISLEGGNYELRQREDGGSDQA